jgi:hypothetical protein
VTMTTGSVTSSLDCSGGSGGNSVEKERKDVG